LRCLLGDPSVVRVGGDAAEVHAAPRQLDEEEHVQPAEPERFDRKEVALNDLGCLLAEELPPAHACPSRRWLDSVSVENVPDAARRQRNAKPHQLAVDPLVAPIRVLRRQTKNELPRLRRGRRPARVSRRIGPAAADEFPMPTQKRRRLDQQRPPTRSRQHLPERRQHGAIGRSQT
jgi:hypothetical protein